MLMKRKVNYYMNGLDEMSLEKVVLKDPEDKYNMDGYVAAYSGTPVFGMVVFANRYLPRIVKSNYSTVQLRELITNYFLDSFLTQEGTDREKIRESMYETMEYIVSHRHMYGG